MDLRNDDPPAAVRHFRSALESHRDEAIALLGAALAAERQPAERAESAPADAAADATTKAAETSAGRVQDLPGDIPNDADGLYRHAVVRRGNPVLARLPVGAATSAWQTRSAQFSLSTPTGTSSSSIQPLQTALRFDAPGDATVRIDHLKIVRLDDRPATRVTAAEANAAAD